jgi:hypothetical protein
LQLSSCPAFPFLVVIPAGDLLLLLPLPFFLLLLPLPLFLSFPSGESASLALAFASLSVIPEGNLLFDPKTTNPAAKATGSILLLTPPTPLKRIPAS